MECTLCPRCCRADRSRTVGCCGERAEASVTRAALHFGEEPIITGTRGSGAVFFTGCSLHCVFCQNRDISGGAEHLSVRADAVIVTPQRLRELYMRLIDAGAHNINLVTPTHFADVIARSLDPVLPVPVVWNSSGYERVETLRRLEGLVSVYMPDMKYSSSLLAEEYSHAPDYPDIALDAIREMLRQTGEPQLDSDGILSRGTLVRHLVLPGAGKNTRGVIDMLAQLPQDFIFSLMAQYTPIPGIEIEYPELGRRITQQEYDRAAEYLEQSGIESYYLQGLDSATEEMLPVFDGTGTN